LTELAREQELYRPNQQLKPQEEFANLSDGIAERRRMLDKLALKRREREQEEKKWLMKVYYFFNVFAF
jgi:hypothetical protein